MPFYKFGKKDIFHNQIKTYHDVSFFIHGRNKKDIFYNNEPIISGAFTSSVPHVPTGYVSLYELNVDRVSGSLIYPFISKGGSLDGFKTVSTNNFNQFAYGTVMAGTYPMSASITRERFVEGAAVINNVTKKPHIVALKTAFDYYTVLSPHYAYSSSYGDKGHDELTVVHVPSIFYGSSIKKGTVNLKFYITGTLAGELSDEKRNGELIQVGPKGSTGSGSVAGVVLYNEGFFVLTGSWALNSSHTALYTGVGNAVANPAWKYFGAGMITSGQDTDNWKPADHPNDELLPSSSYGISFQGTNFTPVVTMFAYAPRAELNHSNNPTYIKYGQATKSFTDMKTYMETDTLEIKNIVSGTYPPQSASFDKHTYISRIGIYDEEKNLIGIAKLATPVKKTEERDFTFKLKLDI